MNVDLLNINFKFSGKSVLHDLNLNIRNQDLIIIFGNNGSGKTTLLNILTGVLECQSGSFYIEKEKIRKLNPGGAFKRGISRTFQEPAVFNQMLISDILLLSLGIKNGFLFKRNDADHYDIVKQILSTYYLEKQIDKKAEELSYGQKKILNFLCVYFTKARLLALDEPLAGVSETSIEQLVSSINEWRSKTIDRSMVIVSHELKPFRDLNAKFFKLENGEISTI
jgi:ABC-type branched-subunit amino acid transport system ATPase component